MTTTSAGRLRGVVVRTGVIVLAVTGVQIARGAVEAEVAQTGFESEWGPCYRLGQWCPLRVDLTLRGQATFQGVLRVIQRDADGDRAITERQIGLSGDGVTRPIWMYALPDLHHEGPFAVQVLDGGGSALMFDDGTGDKVPFLVQRSSANPVDDGHTLVLDMSERTLSALGQSVRILNEALRQPIVLARCRPSGIPPAWFGLQMLDAIIWDAADPTKLDFTQMDALLEWTRRGGHLVVAASRTAGAIRQSRLDAFLPVEIGSTRQTDRLSDLRITRLLGETESELLGQPIAFCEVSLRPGSRVPRELTGPPVVSRTRLGQGRITFVAVELSDLLAVESEPGRLLEGLLAGRRHGPEAAQARFQVPLDLFGDVKQTVDFVRRSGVLMGLAILFVIVYGVTATVVSWHWLKRRNWRHHNWTAFALVVLAASGLSLAAVQAVRGVGTGVHQITVIDLDANRTEAIGTCLFGVKTASHTQLDLLLPSSDTPTPEEDGVTCTLLPMPPAPTLATPAGRGGQWSFLSPLDYRLHPGRGSAEDVPFRATLKQFVGHWSGPLRGSVGAQLQVNRGRVLDSSWVQNNLDEDLAGCYLLIARLDPDVNRTADAIETYELGTIRAGERIERLGSHLESRLMRAQGRSVPGDEPIAVPRLTEIMDKWVRDLTPGLMPGWVVEQERQIDPRNYDKALLLLTVMGEYDESGGAGQIQRPELHGGACRHLDRSDDLTTDTAMLVGFSAKPGPVRLFARASKRKHRDFAPLEPDESRTVYRILIPVK